MTDTWEPPCTAPTAGPPCGPGAAIGTAYPYTLDTSCGLSTILFDGEWWSSGLAAGPAPYGWSDRVAGKATLVKPSGIATFDGGGHHLDLTSPSPQRPSAASC